MCAKHFPSDMWVGIDHDCIFSLIYAFAKLISALEFVCVSRGVAVALYL